MKKSCKQRGFRDNLCELAMFYEFGKSGEKNWLFDELCHTTSFSNLNRVNRVSNCGDCHLVPNEYGIVFSSIFLLLSNVIEFNSWLLRKLEFLFFHFAWLWPEQNRKSWGNEKEKKNMNKEALTYAIASGMIVFFFHYYYHSIHSRAPSLIVCVLFFAFS